jgi:acetyl-CoA acetyltransferase family protein
MSREVWIIDAVRTPIGRHAGALAKVRPDDLAAVTVEAVIKRTGVDPTLIDDVVLGCANQAGEDNRNVARMAVLLAGLPVDVAAQTVNRLCGSGLQAVNSAFHAIQTGDADVMIAGGVESMSRAPFAMLKPEEGYARGAPQIADTVLGWRFVNSRFPDTYTVSLGETAERVAEKYKVSRQDQDEFAVRSQRFTADAVSSGRFNDELIAVNVPGRKNEVACVDRDEHPRPDTTLEQLARLSPAFRKGGTVTAGNSSGLNDGSAALLLAEAGAARAAGLRPLDPDIVNVNGGAIALGHPLGASGARILTTLVHELRRRGGGHGLASMCIGVGQGIATIVEVFPE